MFQRKKATKNLHGLEAAEDQRVDGQPQLAHLRTQVKKKKKIYDRHCIGKLEQFNGKEFGENLNQYQENVEYK